MNKITTIILPLVALSFLTFCSSQDNGPTQPTTPTYYCSINKTTYYSETQYKAYCVPSSSSTQPSYYCSINNTTYYSESQYKANCIDKPISSSSAAEYCCARTGTCYPSQALYNIQCSDSPSKTQSSSSTACTTCDCNSRFNDVYNSMKNTASCASLGEKRCKEYVAGQVGCKL